MGFSYFQIQSVAVEKISQKFPFHDFFNNAPKPLFKQKSYEEDLEIAQGCFRYIEKIFQQLEEFRAFELLRSGLDRSKYLLVKEAKVIAMTCTHAALKRKELVDLGKFTDIEASATKYTEKNGCPAGEVFACETNKPKILPTL